jgi:hypothetical protein
MGDRRQKPRFEIVGELGGTLDTVVTLPLRDAGRGGVLADSPVALTVGALHRITFVSEGVHTPAHVAVRHVRPTTLSTGEQRFLIGLEFASLTPALTELIDRWIVLHGEAAS